MFLNAPLKAGKSKRIVYLIVSTVLGFLLGFIAYALIEIGYWDAVGGQGNSDSLYVLETIFLTVGAIGGFFLGRFWWRMVYIDRVWAKGRRRH